MKSKCLRLPVFTFTTALCGAATFNVYANPHITKVEDDGNELTVIGSGFNEKEHPFPILWVFGSDIKENGQLTNKESNVTIGDSVPIGDDKNKFIWTRGTGTTYTSQTRLKSFTHSYRAEKVGWIGWPTAFGGDDTPYSDKAYISWRVKTDGDIRNYKAIRVESIKGKFRQGANMYEPGEKITISPRDGGEIEGRIVYFDQKNSRLHIEAAGLSSVSSTEASVVGQESGAEATINGSQFFRPSLSGKYLRSYETVSDAGTHSVLSTNRWIAVQYANANTELRRAFGPENIQGYGVPDVSKSNDWQFLEAYIDLSDEYGSGYVSLNNDEKKWYNNLYIGDSKPKDAGPTISNIGWEPAGGTEMVNAALDFGEIYFDKTPQRVILSNSSKYSNARKDIEFQYITSWTNNEIVVSKRIGGLKEEQSIFLYVFDKDNFTNEAGYCIKNCTSSYAPPSPIPLKVD